ncbi:MAG TPA: alpha/beta hydrolase [Ramlibacter sp.]|uniref:alpha/beta fold hydrolase n=1 Tax=Ramlibacter sp. TaxID=1917967 RepID=UPI002ED58A11
MTTWVLLRGLARESRHWGRFLAMLREAVPAGDRVVAIDLPGNGRRFRERSAASVPRIAEAARLQLAKDSDARPPYLLLALSLGGMVAVQWALQDPSAVRGCILVNSSMRGLSQPWQRLRPAALLQLLATLAGPTPLARERRIVRLTSNREPDDAVAAAWADYAAARPVTHGNMLRQLLAAARFRAPEAAPAVPLLLLASRGDRLASVECSRAMARAWLAPLREHPDAGHDLTLDEPAWVVAQALAWSRALPAEP